MPATSSRSWELGPEHPVLAEGTLHVWRTDLTAVGEDVLGLLTPEEQARAARFPRERDGRLWAGARGVLRALLGRYLDLEPSTLRFGSEAHGKPVLLGSASSKRVSFNLSHSQQLALFAFTKGGAVGVDIEIARPRVDALAIAARAFGAEEARRLQHLDPPDREWEFLRAWVRHEAVLKCRGTGIGGVVAGDASESCITQLDVGSEAAAAVALDRAPRELRCWEFRG